MPSLEAAVWSGGISEKGAGGWLSRRPKMQPAYNGLNLSVISFGGGVGFKKNREVFNKELWSNIWFQK